MVSPELSLRLFWGLAELDGLRKRAGRRRVKSSMNYPR